MTDDELSELLDDTEDNHKIDFSDISRPPRKTRRNPDDLYDRATDYLKSIEAVVYMISNGVDSYCGRSVSLHHRLHRHGTSLKSKAYKIINEYKGDKNDLITILWRGPYLESMEKEADAIERYSTVGQKKEQAMVGQIPVEFPARKRINTIPDMNKIKKMRNHPL
ncbi:hypothetical protein VCR12J2_1030081 [Vibrio coralliirubri]|uniref:GIY-YIG nuclease family protein n=1 Tax=Vibrio coralliirubri TaxID=1516159 RepID=UPI0006369996|nr:GIY-YIG nuclease family protein [Vibrio coralliirubri]CDT80703.1 hypothetical protein VCR12J2_1030081 [Vibrio coralliirubri]